MFDKAEHRSDDLEKNYELLEQWKEKGDDLLYSMIPKTVADRLRTGISPLDTCEVSLQSLNSFSKLIFLLTTEFRWSNNSIL